MINWQNALGMFLATLVYIYFVKKMFRENKVEDTLAKEQESMPPGMQGLAAQLESDLYGSAGSDALPTTQETYPSLQEYLINAEAKLTKPKWKVSYYNRIYKSINNGDILKVRTKKFGMDYRVQVFFNPSGKGEYLAMDVYDDGDLKVHITPDGAPTFTLPIHHAADLYVALNKFFEVYGYKLVKVGKPNV